jgi:hypothetical protein
MGRPFSFAGPEGAALCRLFEREWARRKGKDKLPKQRQRSQRYKAFLGQSDVVKTRRSFKLLSSGRPAEKSTGARGLKWANSSIPARTESVAPLSNEVTYELSFLAALACF